MLRQLINVVRYVLQALRKYIKPLILIVSFVTFVWLIVDTAHRPEFVRHASKHSFRRNRTSDQADRWDQHSVQRFLDLLDIDLNVSVSGEPRWPAASCQQEDAFLLTAFAGSSLLEHLWHFFSLIALRHSAGVGRGVRTMLTVTARAELSQLFVSLPEEVVDQQTIACYDIPSACILNDDTSIELPEGGSQLFILNNNVKRLREILQVSWEDLAGNFELDPNDQRIANDILGRLRQRWTQNDLEGVGTGLQFVGITVGEEDGLPFEYYYRAITFQRKMYDGGMLLVVVLCENPKGTICSMLNAQSEHLYVLLQNPDPGVNFALMTLCNHTIVSHERDIFPALLRGSGNTVVYGYQDEYSQNIGLKLASYKENWYTIV
uniref:Uncharacterized protein n=1 Tax=Anopheles atroparvus TaxID=41427 RepID=A0AAG5DRY4_ANOAO